MSRLLVACLAIATIVHVMPNAPALSPPQSTCYENPCADTACPQSGGAAAHAFGNHYSRSEARAGNSYEGHESVNGGTTHAAVWAVGDARANAHGRTGESNARASCSESAVPVANAALLPPALLDTARIACNSAGAAVPGSFLGEVHVGATGVLVAYDPELALGLPLSSLAVAFDSRTLVGLVPLDVSAMTPAGVVIGLDVATTADGGVLCSASMRL